MPLPRHQNGQPTYRLVLTLSVAFLLHTLILAAILHNWALEPTPKSSTVRFTLLADRQEASKASAPSRSSAASSPAKNEPAHKTPDPYRADARPEAAPTREPAPAEQQRPPTNQSESLSLEAGESHRSFSPRNSPRMDAASNPSSASSQSSMPSPPGAPSQQNSAGSPVETPTPDIREDRAQLPEEEIEQDPYVSLLWRHISDELDSRPVRSIRSLKQVRTVRLELHLLESGALRRVDTVESSGKATLDLAARQSALAASPYPEPPESARDRGFRFQVELRFSPRAE
ncbi:energy transducer TonB family protein [Marinobacter fonticola]|uniref:energy transducer TonB family protein n=1 Tax=Marinobacter fonticola TaxID=2603215 RepID=UPI0011E665C4|nr:energy transducer TonB [Marinobacter fonticola]